MRRIEPPDFIPGLLHQLANQIVQCNIHSCFCGGIPRCNRIDILQDVVHLKRVVKLVEIQRRKETGGGFNVLFQVGWH